MSNIVIEALTVVLYDNGAVMAFESDGNPGGLFIDKPAFSGEVNGINGKYLIAVAIRDGLW